MRLPRLNIGHILIVVLLGAGAYGGYFAYDRWFGGKATAAPAQLLVPVTRGSISATVSASGNIAIPHQAKVSFAVAGTVSTVAVHEGDTVQANQVLATLDQSALELKLNQAQSTLRSAQIKLQQLMSPAAAADVQAAQAAVDGAQGQLTSAQNNLADVLSTPKPDDVTAAQIALNQAKNSLWSAQLNRDGTCGNPRNAQYQCDAANAQVGNAEEAVRAAQLKLEQAQAPATSEAIAAAQATVKSAQSSLQSAQAKLDAVRAGATATDIASAQEAINQAQIGVQGAQSDLNGVLLKAPIAGVVVGLAISPGDQAQGGATALTVVDASVVQMSAQVAEADIPRLAMGQAATVTVDALSGTTLTGKVTVISPLATTQSGVVSYAITVQLDPAKDVSLKDGMTAEATITVEQRDNVLLVPSKALKTQGGVHTVLVSTGGKNTEQRTVEVGLSDSSNTEIVSGLSEGEKVVLGGTTTTSQTTSTGFPGGGFPGGGGFRIGGD